ncbi:TonB-dependent siderophore receptor [Xanthobacter sp. 126]|uniref:TonB-dependent siderophore receptor n=1 Tax=Xanthobacter sp. 126 TaxID=1131814 RepID=UPI0009DCD956|nr:TonB-dependent siderophore receptor [Xanthobacter sp. 126]
MRRFRLSDKGAVAPELPARRAGAALISGVVVSALAAVPALAQTVEPETFIGTVSVDAESGQARVYTEGKDTYTASETTVGVGAPTPVREIPQSISTVTRQRIDDQNFTQLEDAMRRTTGMVILANDQGRSSIFSRGFEIDTLLVNNLPAPLSSILGTQPDLFIFDRLDVLKGPAGLFYGSAGGGNGGPGGVINGTLKPALDKYFLNSNVSYGSWDFMRAEVDAGGKLNEKGTVRARIGGAFQDRDSFVDYNQNQVWVGYGTLAFDITDDTTLSLYAWHQEREMLPFNGLPAINLGNGEGKLLNVPRSTFVGGLWNRFDNETTDYLAELKHDLSNGGEAKASLRYSDRYIDYKYAYGRSAVSTNPATLGNFTMQYTAAKVWETSLSGDAHVATPVQAFGQEHNITFGADFRSVDQTQLSPTSTTLPGTYNIYSFNPYAVPEPVTVYNRESVTDPTQYGVYGQAKINPIEQVHIILGGRLSWYDATSNVTTATGGSLTRTTSSVDIDNEFLPYAGFVVDLTTEVSAYGSYTTTFVPQTELNAAGDVLPPRQGYQYEAGLKGSFFDGALNASAAMFIIRDNNRALATDVANVYVASGEVQVSGWEAEVSGKLAPGWEIYAGYTYTETEYLTATPAQLKAGFSTYTPKHNYNLWTKYEFQDPTLKGWHVAGGVKILSSFYTKSGGVTLTEDGYTVVDAQIGYKFNDNWKATLTATNIFDEVYYTRVGSTALFNFYGEPRGYWLKVSATY